MDQVLNLLRPDTLGAIFLYVLFFMGLTMLFIIPEKNETPVYLVYALIAFVILDFLRARSPDTFIIKGGGLFTFGNKGFFTFLIHIAIAILPLVAGAMTRKQGRKGGAVLPVGIFTAFVGGIYAVLAFVAASAVYTPFGG